MTNKTALILGITGGVGQELAKAFLERGFSVIGTSHQKSNSTLPIQSPNLTIFPLEFNDRTSIDHFLTQIKAIKIDFFINTIGSYTLNRFENISITAFEKDLTINFTNQVYSLQKIIPRLNPGANAIFLLTDMVLDRTPAFLCSYVSSKFALLGLMISLSKEYSSKGLRFNAISPSMMETNFVSSLPQFVKEQYVENSPKKRFTPLKEVSSIILKIIDDTSINGQNIPIY